MGFPGENAQVNLVNQLGQLEKKRGSKSSDNLSLPLLCPWTWDGFAHVQFLGLAEFFTFNKLTKTRGPKKQLYNSLSLQTQIFQGHLGVGFLHEFCIRILTFHPKPSKKPSFTTPSTEVGHTHRLLPDTQEDRPCTASLMCSIFCSVHVWFTKVHERWSTSASIYTKKKHVGVPVMRFLESVPGCFLKWWYPPNHPF